MNIAQQLVEALESLAANKLRTGLTMLGIIIGVAAVIAMLAIGNGAQSSIDSQINSVGSNLISITSGAEGVDHPEPLTTEDAAAIGDPSQAPSVLKVTPMISGRLEVTYSGESKVITVYGVDPAALEINNLKIAEGDFIDDTSLLARSSVAVIGPDTANNLFGRKEGVTGESIRINGQSFRVIGVLESKGGSSMGSQDDRIFIPLSTAQIRLFNRDNANQVDQILAQSTTADTVNQAADEITQILQIRHHTPIGEDDFTIFKQQDILDVAQSITGVFTIFLGGIGGISLLVGGIGIMNIMLVSVTERTREIGLRKALGARRRDILIQFLLESATMSLIGGAFGVLLAWIITRIVAIIATASGTAFEPIIGLDSILLATLFSAAIGLFFGIYPANRAASLAPVEALRSE